MPKLRVFCAVTNVTSSLTYNWIALCDNNPNNSIPDGEVVGNLTACTLVTGSGTEVTEGNPIQPAISNLTTTSYDVVQTFTATAAITILEFQLVKTGVIETPPAVANIGAIRGGSVTLAATDSITITWTVTIT